MHTDPDGPALRKIAAQAGDRSCYAIAKRARVSQQTVQRIVRGTTTPSLPTLLRLATAYGVSVDELLDRPHAAPLSDAA